MTRREQRRGLHAALLRAACLAALCGVAQRAAATPCPPAASVRTLAGAGVRGSGDGIGAAALFASPGGVAAASAGDVLWIADTGNHRLRRLDLATGAVVTVAGAGIPGFADGAAPASLFSAPRGVAVDAGGTVYVADTDNGRIRAVNASTGAVSTLAGSGSRVMSRDGVAAQAMFLTPTGLAWDAATPAVLYVADDTAVRAVSLPDGSVTTLAGGGVPGYVDAAGTSARFSGACAVAVDAAGGMLYVADSGNGRVRSVALDGSGAVRTLAGGGSAPVYGDSAAADGARSNATLAAPAGLAWLEAEGMLLLAEAGGSRLRTINVTSGLVTTVAGGMRGGSGMRDGVGVGALLNAPAGLAASASPAGAAAFLADAGSHALRAVSLAVAAKLTLEVTAVGEYDPPLSAGGLSYTSGSYDVLYRNGGGSSDVGDVLRAAGETHTLEWCAYDDGRGDERGDIGTLVLRGAVEATLSAAPDAEGPTSDVQNATLLTWRGTEATHARVLHLGLPRPGCTQSTAVNYNPFATSAADATCEPGFPAALYVHVDRSAPFVAAAGAGYSLDGPGLHVDADQFAAPLAPDELHVAQVTLRCGAAYLARVWGAADAMLLDAAGGEVLWQQSGGSVATAADVIRAPRAGPCASTPGMPPRGATVALTAAQASTSASWFSFGVWSLGPGGAAPLDAAPVLPAALFATADETVLPPLPALAPGLYYVEFFGNVSGTVTLLQAPPVSAQALAATGAWPLDADADDAAAVAAAQAAEQPPEPLLVFGPAAQAAAAQEAPAWGSPFTPLSSSDEYGGRLAGGARRAYFAVPQRRGGLAAGAGGSGPLGGVVGTPADGDAAAWVPAAAAGVTSPPPAVQPLRLAELAGMALPPPRLGRVVSAVHALTPLRARLAAPITLVIPYDAVEAESAPASDDDYPGRDAGLTVLRASDTSGSDWRVVPGAIFVAGTLAVTAAEEGGVYCVSLRAAVSALWPRYGSTRGGTRLQLAGAAIAPARLAACRFGADGIAAYAPTLPGDGGGGPSTPPGLPQAHVRCITPRSRAPGWASVEFVDGGTLSVTSSGFRFLFLAPPRVAAVHPPFAPLASAGAWPGALLRLTGARLAPPQGASWVCALGGDGGAGAPEAHVVSSALAICEAPRSPAAPDDSFALRLGPRSDGPDAGAFPDGASGAGALAFEAQLQAGPAHVAHPDGPAPRMTRPWPHGGGLVVLPLAGGAAPGARAAATLRIGTITVAARPTDAAADAAAVAAVAPAGGPAPGGGGVPIALAGAPGLPDVFVGTLYAAEPPSALEVWPRAAVLRGGAPITVSAASDYAQPPEAPPLACLLDGVASGDASPQGTAAWRCALLPRRYGFAALSLAAVRLSPAAAAPPVPLLLLPPPTARAAHPAAPTAPGGAVIWLTGADLAPPPGFGLRAACIFGDGSSGTSPAHVVSSALVACEAPFALRPGAAQTVSIGLQEDLPDASAALASPGAGAPLALARPAAPVLLSASPSAALSGGGGSLVTLRGTGLGEADAPLLSCAFGTIAPVAPAWRAGAGGLACVSPARDPQAPPVALSLMLPGGWRSDAAIALYYADDDAADDMAAMPPAGGPAYGGEPLTLAGPPAALRPPPGAGAAECRFLGAPGAAVPASPYRATSEPSDDYAVALGSGAFVAALRCASPPLAGAPRFVAVALTWQPVGGPLPPPLPAPPGALTAAELAAASAPLARPLRGVQFDYRAPPALRRAFPAAAPSAGGGGVLVSLSGRGFDPGAANQRCAFRFAEASPALDGGGSVAYGAAVAHSSALVACEAPPPPQAQPGARFSGGAAREVTLPGSAALPFDYAEQPAAAAATPRFGLAAGGTHVVLTGSAFLGADVTTLCQFGTVRVAAVVHNATTLSCAAPAGAPGRTVPLAAVALGWPGAPGLGATPPLLYTYYSNY